MSDGCAGGGGDNDSRPTDTGRKAVNSVAGGQECVKALDKGWVCIEEIRYALYGGKGVGAACKKVKLTRTVCYLNAGHAPLAFEILQDATEVVEYAWPVFEHDLDKLEIPQGILHIGGTIIRSWWHWGRARGSDAGSSGPRLDEVHWRLAFARVFVYVWSEAVLPSYSLHTATTTCLYCVVLPRSGSEPH